MDRAVLINVERVMPELSSGTCLMSHSQIKLIRYGQPLMMSQLKLF